jgi:hypothetical protein
MKIVLGNARAGVIAAALVLSSLGGTALAAESAPEKETSLTDQATEYVRDYLSDHRRAGSLAGSILGGALMAHPIGPVLGSLVGFFIGKQTMFNEDKTRGLEAQSVLAKRDIVPQGGKAQGIPTLSFANSQGITFDTPPAAVAETAPPATAPALVPQRLPIPMAVPTISREKIATMCGCCQAHLEPRLRSLCFYFQGNWQDDKKPAGPVVSLATP